MSNNIRGASLLFACALSGAAFAASGPITSHQVAARGVVTSVIASSSLGELDGAFVYVPRSIVDTTLRKLQAATTYDALLAPGGVSLPCPISGNLTARVSATRLTTLQLDWAQCVSSDYGSRNTVEGPVEVVWAGRTLSPASVASIRLGNAVRDYVTVSRPETPQTYYDGTTVYRNQRATGVLPVVLEFGDFGNFTGRYLVETKGFVRRVHRMPEFNSDGEPSVEFYEYESRMSTDGAILTGAYSVAGLDNVMEWGLVAGKVAGSYTYPARPLHPVARTIEQWYRGTGLVAHRRWDNAAGEYFHSIDGKVEGDFNEFWNLGCSGPDTFVYRTRKELGQSPYSYFVEQYDSGELSINGNTTATFTATGTEPYVDLIGHAAVKVQGLGTVNYDYPESIALGPILEAARCTP